MIFHFLCDKDEAGFEKEMIFPCSKLDLSSMFGVTGKMDLELFHFLSLSLSLSHTFLHARTHMPVYPHTHPSLFIHTFMHTHTPSKHCLTKTKLSFHVRSCLVLGRYTMNRSYVERILFWKSLKDLHLFSFSPLE